MQGEVAGVLAQFGMAGLIAWMWLTERRAGLARERQIEEAHRRLTQEQEAMGVVLRVVEANTRAMASLEIGQRELAALIRELRPGREAAGMAGPAANGAR
ncbi:MAG: hypothetical protein RIE77_05575 [Phycisphaerales bacterium]|jgi:hypothetical protein